MSKIYADDFNKKPLSGGQNPNGWSEDYSMAKAANSGDVLYLGIIPAGIAVQVADLVFDDCGVAVTASLGYEAVDGVSLAAAPTAWLSAVDVATAAGRSRSIAHPIEFQTPVYLTVTIGGANLTGTPKVTAVISGKGVGVR